MACETESCNQAKTELTIVDDSPYEIAYDGEHDVSTMARWSSISDGIEEVTQIVFAGKLSAQEIVLKLQQMDDPENLDLPESCADYGQIIRQLRPFSFDPSAFCGEVFND